MSNHPEILITEQEYEQLKKELYLWQMGFQNLIFEFEKIYKIVKEK